ncbi:type I polyketide synthase [Streptomyces sp. A1136]|uniref:type I polyketide synthase n=1 Tax=Streptomyces sp. A1136 TaxID=2563102 RepID=UPI00109E9FFB|nr:type I polyketide synthase [Streptomyces sp. A1136]THA54613.1 acyltransferase domain-containing protein [Streptomyces sp. A1136]
MGDIAVVGIDCFFPGAYGTDAYWELLLRSGDAIGGLPDERWTAADFPAVSRGGFADGIDSFDHAFFSVSPREAAAMDPHQRMLLQCAWRAIEDSGTAPPALAGTDTGVFVGMMGGEWGRLTMSDHRWVTPQLGAGGSAGMTANRVSYHLNLSGPSLTVDTACSSSLVAVHLAVNSLLSGETSTALAAGVNLVLSPSLGLVYEQLGLAAPDGRCKPFSAEADGIGRGDGVAVVVLRRLEDALADGSRVYAVIRGTAVNQDGRSNGVTAPSRWAQQKVLEAAYRRAGVTPDQVRFVEAHGTGTVLGDAIECAALGAVHGVRRAEPCALGSVKGNLGHTEGAAGLAGLIKTALALHHRLVPASRFADRENPRLRLAERGLRLLKSPLRLPRGETVAGVSSFGMGGTNVHAVLATAPRRIAAGGSAAARVPAPGSTGSTAGVFTLTADSPEGLRRNLAVQAAAVAARPRGAAAALCRSSNRVKTGLPYRFATTARDTGELAAALFEAAEADADAVVGTRRAPSWSRPTVAFLFTGQGSEYPGMTAGLHRESAAYRRHLEEADAALAPHTGFSVRELLLGADPRVRRTRYAQPALFAVGYALAATLDGLGVRPVAVLGHSAGEFAAAVTAGALTLAEAAELVAVRGALMEELPRGAMLAVGIGRGEIAPLLAAEPEAVLAAVNGPSDVTVSGPVAVLDRIERALRADGVRARRLGVAHAFHSPGLQPVLGRLRERAERTAAVRPQIPFASCRYGRMLREEPLDAAYWVGQAAEPVLFGEALEALVRESAPTHLLEVGPRPQLLPLAGRSGAARGRDFLHPCPGPESGGRELAEVVAALYRAGLDPDWATLYEPRDRGDERLAPYVFSTESRFRNGRRALAAPADTAPPAGPAHTGTTEPASAVRTPAAAAAASGTASQRTGGSREVLAAVIAAVSEVGGYANEEIVPTTRFYEDLGFDSVMIMQLKDRIEARLPRLGEISVPHMLPALRSVATLADHLGVQITAKAAPAA